MLNIGGKVIIENCNYTGKDLLSITNIIYSKQNLESILAYIANMINQLNYILLIDEQTDYLYLLRKADFAISKLNAPIFLKSYGKRILDNDEAIKEFLVHLVSGIQNTSWISKIKQKQLGIYDKISYLYKEQYINSDYYEIKNSSSSVNYVEIPVYYNERITKNESKINFSKPEYIRVLKSKLHMNPNNYRFIDYAIINVCDNIFSHGDLLLIQGNTKLRENDTVILVKDGVCYIGEYKNTLGNIVLISNNCGNMKFADSDIQYLGKALEHIKK